MELAGKKLGILLTTPPEHVNFARVVSLIRAALQQKISVYLYCIDNGVSCVNTPEIQSLKNSGIHLFGCAYGAHHRNIPVDDKAAYSGLTIVADMVAGTDRFLTF